MIRGTTPLLVFNMPNHKPSEFTYIQLTFADSRGHIILEKASDDAGGNPFTIVDKSVQIRLSEAETLSFKPGEIAFQLRISIGTQRLASSKKTILVNDILKDGLLE